MYKQVFFRTIIFINYFLKTNKCIIKIINYFLETNKWLYKKKNKKNIQNSNFLKNLNIIFKSKILDVLYFIYYI